MYQVIARKYRPQNFGELIGQEHVRTTLENAITSSRIAHGYIFSGQRGTGKTTVARILARCLNCINGPTAHPCGVCASCVEVTAGNSPDVIEIDAASNRGINEMRELRENVRYRPARDRFKVFIVDEAHQITSEAFNALLKTLEEPPEWAVFVLCTTESHKIPNTIASRCQQFNFRSVDFTELVSRMEHILREEGIEADADVLAVVAQAGEGSVRDSLSALDQAIACCGNTLRVDEIRSLLGIFAVNSLQQVADAVISGDSTAMLNLVQELERTGQSLQHFCRELARYWRNLLVAKISAKPTRLIAASDNEQKALLNTAAQFSEEDLTRYLQLTLDLYKNLQFSLQPRLHLELGLVKLVHVGRLQSIEDAIANLPDNGSSGSTSKQTSSNSTTTPPRSAEPKPAPTLSASTRTEIPRPAPFHSTKPTPKPSPIAVPADTASPAPTGDLKTDLHTAFVAAGMAFSADAIAHAEVKLEGNELLLTAPRMSTLALKDPAVARLAVQVIGKPVKIKVEAGAGMAAVTPNAVSGRQRDNGSDAEVTERALAHPGVKRFQELFPDAQVRTVRNLSE